MADSQLACVARALLFNPIFRCGPIPSFIHKSSLELL